VALGHADTLNTHTPPKTPLQRGRSGDPGGTLLSYLCQAICLENGSSETELHYDENGEVHHFVERKCVSIVFFNKFLKSVTIIYNHTVYTQEKHVNYGTKTCLICCNTFI
jgi:hypothetical protein